MKIILTISMWKVENMVVFSINWRVSGLNFIAIGAPRRKKSMMKGSVAISQQTFQVCPLSVPSWIFTCYTKIKQWTETIFISAESRWKTEYAVKILSQSLHVCGHSDAWYTAISKPLQFTRSICDAKARFSHYRLIDLGLAEAYRTFG